MLAKIIPRSSEEDRVEAIKLLGLMLIYTSDGDRAEDNLVNQVMNLLEAEAARLNIIDDERVCISRSATKQ